MPRHAEITINSIGEIFFFSTILLPYTTKTRIIVIVNACLFITVILFPYTQLLMTIYIPVAKIIPILQGVKPRKIAFTYKLSNKSFSTITIKSIIIKERSNNYE